MSTFNILVLPQAIFDTEDKRKAFAQFVSSFFSRGDENEGADVVPYQATPPYSDIWVLDRRNDWQLVFDKENLRSVRLNHRYGEQVLVEAATRFIASFHSDVECFITSIG